VSQVPRGGMVDIPFRFLRPAVFGSEPGPFQRGWSTARGEWSALDIVRHHQQLITVTGVVVTNKPKSDSTH
jgi:hypothetical protein